MTELELLDIFQKAAKAQEKFLYFNSKPLREIPQEIGRLSKLQYLYFERTQLCTLPPDIGRLSSLEHFNLHGNQLRTLPPDIGELAKLRYLDISGNELNALPPEIGKLSNLEELYLGNNQLTELPPEIGQLSKLRRIDLTGNPIEKPPPEILSKGCKAILEFLKQELREGLDYIYEAKLLIVGEGGAGKTSLAKKIQNKDYQLVPLEQSTEGIDIIRWEFPFKDGQRFIVNIWDFGGQEIYHATHQFFLTKRSLYILVVDSRREDTDFFYWLNVADLLSEASPILIVKNEKQDRQWEINERQLRGEFLNLKDVLATNLKDNRGLSSIKKAIKHYISTLPHVGSALPKTWVKVRQALETDSRNYITLEEYLDLCEENGFTRYEDKLQLSGYLHDLGVCLHFQEDDLLRKTVVLNPTWGTDAVYKVLDNTQVIKNLGKFNRNNLATIWFEDKYSSMQPELLRLMMNFKLCYEIPNCPKTYIAPQLLSPNQPEFTWDETGNLLLRYSYEFMPKGILTRFVVEMHSWIEDQTCVWRTGLVLNKDGARAEIVELYHFKHIRIRVYGDRRRDLLTTIRHEFDKIHATYERLKFNTLVPCNCRDCRGKQEPHFYHLSRLHQFQKDGKSIQCPVSYAMVEVQTLVSDISKGGSKLNKKMSDVSRKNEFKAEVIQYFETNSGQPIGKQVVESPILKKSVDEIYQILKNLQENYPTATEAEAVDLIEVEFEEIRISKPAKWKLILRQLLEPDRWFSGGKSALLATMGHFVEESVFGKAGVAFLEGFSEEDQN